MNRNESSAGEGQPAGDLNPMCMFGPGESRRRLLNATIMIVEACRLCGSTQAVITKEHIPPKSAGNRGTHVLQTTRFRAGVSRENELLDGFALRVLCTRCNSRFGSRLGTTFGTFVQQIQQSGRFISPRGGVYAGAVDVYPSRVIRQLLLNFLCIQETSDEDRLEDVREYVRSRDAPLPADAPRIGLYYNISNTYRIVPVGGITSLKREGALWTGAEIAAPGLGVVFTLGDPGEVDQAILPRMADISSWANYGFADRIRVVFELPRYRVETPHPLGFGRPIDVDKWQSRNLILWLATKFDTDVESDIGAALWRPVRRQQY